MLSFHASLFSKKELVKAVEKVKKLGVKVGLALNPNDPIDLIEHVLDRIDYVLIMSVYAGFGGQKFIPAVLKKIEALRIDYGFKGDIEIDGGIDDRTIRKASVAGANVFVSGSYIFKSKDRKKAIEKLRGALV